MMLVLQTILRIFQLPQVQRAKPFTLHCSLLFLVLGYAFAGGMVFNRLEADALRKHVEDELHTKVECVKQKLSDIYHLNGSDKAEVNRTAETLSVCFAPERDARSEWSFVTATLYGFGIVTTLGYNRIAPITYAGRLFCIGYGICGIPLTMIIIANVGQYLNQFAGDSRRMLEEYRQRRRMSKASLNGEEYKESSIQDPEQLELEHRSLTMSSIVTSVVLLIVFLLYVALGALLLPALNGKIDFFNGLYYNFLCLTAIDFGQLVPSKVAFLPITFLYVCLGLAITTIAIDIGSEYMKKLHYLGKKMKDAAQTKIWFGGRTLKVRDLLHAVGKKCGVDPLVIDALDLENVVERTIALQEGRDPPSDTNDEPPKEPIPRSAASSPQEPPEDAPLLTRTSTPKTKSRPQSITSRPPSVATIPCPDLIIKNPIFESISHDLHVCSPVEEVHSKVPQSVRLEIPEEFVDDIQFEDSIQIFDHPPVLDEVELHNVSHPMKGETELLPEKRQSLRPRIFEEEEEEEEKVPRKFREKKKMYGTDPRKLFETYQEEWERLQRLSARLGPRRKSIIALSTSGSGDESTSTSRQTSPHRERSSRDLSASRNGPSSRNESPRTSAREIFFKK